MATILIIDDSPQTLDMLREVLEAAGYEVVSARNGVEGMEHFHEKHPDLIVTDIFMPQKEGLETIQEVRREAPKLPIITISSGGLMDGKVALRVADRLGSTRSFEKPFDLNEFLAAVKELLEAS